MILTVQNRQILSKTYKTQIVTVVLFLNIDFLIDVIVIILGLKGFLYGHEHSHLPKIVQITNGQDAGADKRHIPF